MLGLLKILNANMLMADPPGVTFTLALERPPSVKCVRGLCSNDPCHSSSARCSFGERRGTDGLDRLVLLCTENVANVQQIMKDFMVHNTDHQQPCCVLLHYAL